MNLATAADPFRDRGPGPETVTVAARDPVAILTVRDAEGDNTAEGEYKKNTMCLLCVYVSR